MRYRMLCFALLVPCFESAAAATRTFIVDAKASTVRVHVGKTRKRVIGEDQIEAALPKQLAERRLRFDAHQVAGEPAGLQRLEHER